MPRYNDCRSEGQENRRMILLILQLIQASGWAGNKGNNLHSREHFSHKAFVTVAVCTLW